MNKCWNAEFKYNYYVDLALNKIPQAQQYLKFGVRPIIQKSIENTLWDYPDLDKYIFQDGAQEHYISSSNNTDTQIIQIEGLDSEYRHITKQIQLQGQTTLSIGIWTRTFRAFNNNSTNLAGQIYVYEDTTVTNGIPDDPTKVRAYIDVNEQQTRMLIYTIPANYTGLLTDLSSSIGVKTDATIKYRFKIREFGKVFRTVVPWNISAPSPPFTFSPNIKGVLPEKTDIEVTVITEEQNISTSGLFFIELQRNN